MTLQDYLRKSSAVIETTIGTLDQKKIDGAIKTIADAFQKRRAVLVCGNGGSACDAMHIAGEMVGRFIKERPAQKCIALTADSAVMTAWSNDYSYDTVFSRQVEALGEEGGVLWGISTSGNSGNVLKAMEQAKKMGMTTIALTGQGGGKMAAISDILLDVPSKETPFIQQVHICLYHYICGKIDEAL